MCDDQYMRDEEDVVDGLGDKGMGDDSGWKQVSHRHLD